MRRRSVAVLAGAALIVGGFAPAAAGIAVVTGGAHLATELHTSQAHVKALDRQLSDMTDSRDTAVDAANKCHESSELWRQAMTSSLTAISTSLRTLFISPHPADLSEATGMAAQAKALNCQAVLK